MFPVDQGFKIRACSRNPLNAAYLFGMVAKTVSALAAKRFRIGAWDAESLWKIMGRVYVKPP